jgi:hypothetical protein
MTSMTCRKAVRAALQDMHSEVERLYVAGGYRYHPVSVQLSFPLSLIGAWFPKLIANRLWHAALVRKMAGILKDWDETVPFYATSYGDEVIFHEYAEMILRSDWFSRDGVYHDDDDDEKEEIKMVDACEIVTTLDDDFPVERVLHYLTTVGYVGSKEWYLQPNNWFTSYVTSKEE